jgi:hypothetical protein
MVQLVHPVDSDYGVKNNKKIVKKIILLHLHLVKFQELRLTNKPCPISHPVSY